MNLHNLVEVSYSYVSKNTVWNKKSHRSGF